MLKRMCELAICYTNVSTRTHNVLKIYNYKYVTYI